MFSDLTLIWENERTHVEWVNIAITEYFGRWSSAGRRRQQCNTVHCWRDLNHIGPHIRLDWRSKQLKDGCVAMYLEEYTPPEDSPDAIRMQIPLYVHL